MEKSFIGGSYWEPERGVALRVTLNLEKKLVLIECHMHGGGVSVKALVVGLLFAAFLDPISLNNS